MYLTYLLLLLLLILFVGSQSKLFENVGCALLYEWMRRKVNTNDEHFDKQSTCPDKDLMGQWPKL